MNRNNPHDNFEACYLKANCARKAFANTTAIQDLLSSRDFDRCMSYVAKIIFVKNKDVLMKTGFDYEDMLNVVKVLGLQFVNHPFVGKTPKDTSYVLMRHTMQRISTFFQFLNRKFRISERHLEINFEDMEQATDGWEESVPDAVFDSEFTIFESDLDPEQKMIQEQVRQDKLQEMRSRLTDNLDEYKDKLSEIATSKIAAYPVRKKARDICRKNGIDYVGWAKQQIAARNLNAVDFVLE